MSKAIIELKAWQIFAITFGLPWLAGQSVNIWLIPKINRLEESNDGAEALLNGLGALVGPSILILVIFFVGLAVQLAWMWRAAHVVHDSAPSDTRVSLTNFRKVVIWYPLIFVVASVVGLVPLATGFTSGEPSVFAIGVAVFCGIGCLVGAITTHIYVCYFIAKNLVLAEKGELSGSESFIGEFFLTWIFAVGIWFLHPRVTKLSQIKTVKQQSKVVGGNHGVL